MTDTEIKDQIPTQVITPQDNGAIEPAKPKTPDFFQILELAKSSPSELVKMVYHGKDAGIELKSQGASVGPLQRLFVIISVVMGVIMFALIFAKEYALFFTCLKLWLGAAATLALIYCIILVTKPELMNNWHLLIKVIEQNFFGDNHKGQVEDSEQIKVYQPAEILVTNQVKASIAPKKEIQK